MIIGTCKIKLLIPDSRSLKEKRYVLKSLKTQVRNKFNCSIAEIEGNNLWQSSVLGVAVVSNQTKYANQVLSKIVEFIENNSRVQLLDYSMEII